jgi:diacylglycerol O-acyltransferase / wax synthase
MERMSTLDAGFYLVDHCNVPMHLGSVAVFDGPAPQLAELVRLYAARLAGLPRYRQVVRSRPLQLLRPAWVSDADFGIWDHVRYAKVASPGGDAELGDLASRVFAEPLDPRKPLWEAWLLDGLAGGRWAVLSKVHHCMVDGVGGSDLMTVIFGTEPEPARGCLAAEPDGRDDGPGEAVAWPVRQMAAAAGSLLTQLPGLPDVICYGRGLARGARRLAVPSMSSLNGPAGPRRRWAWTSASLDDARQIRASLGGSVNDVVLAAVTGSFRRLLHEAELTPGVVIRSLVPVSLRTATQAGAITNRLSAVLVNLPVGEAELRARLELIRAQTGDLKRTHQAAGPELLLAMLAPVAPPVLALGLRAAFRVPQPLVQTVTTNVPGPRTPLSALGRPMIAAYPYAPIGGNVRVSVAIYSYLDKLYFGITSDHDAVTDPAALTTGIDQEMAALGQLAGRSQGTDTTVKPARAGHRGPARNRPAGPRPVPRSPGIERRRHDDAPRQAGADRFRPAARPGSRQLT